MNEGLREAIFLSVRDKATRLPGKVMAPICGRPAIVHLIDRLKLSKLADALIMTTSVNPGDDGLAAIAHEQGIVCFRGSEDDKLRRYLDAADAYGVGFCVVVDGDDLFCDPVFVDRIIADHGESAGDYIVCDDLPMGATGFGIATEALRRVIEIKDDDDTEVWGGYFTDTGLFDARALTVDEPRFRRPDLRMTLDYPEDLAFFTAVFEELYEPGTVFSFTDIIGLLERRPDIAALNAGLREAYAASLSARATVHLKPGALDGA